MVECGAEEVDEDTMIRAIRAGHEAMQPFIDVQWQLREALGKPKREVPLAALPEEVRNGVRALVGDRIDQALVEQPRQGRSARRRWTACVQEALEPLRGRRDGEPQGRDRRLRRVPQGARARAHPRRLGVRPDGRGPSEMRALVQRGLGLAPRPRHWPLPARRDPGAVHHDPGHSRRGAATGHAAAGGDQALHAPLQLPALLDRRDLADPRPTAARDRSRRLGRDRRCGPFCPPRRISRTRCASSPRSCRPTARRPWPASARAP